MAHSVVKILFAAMLAMPELVFAQVNIEERIAPGQPPVVEAHRAKGGGYPKNTLAGIQYAVHRGIDMVEIDVQITSDGHHVLLHDWIGDKSLGDIRQMRLMDDHGVEHSVPTLEEALELIDGRLLVNLDLKTYDIESLLPLLEAQGTDNLLLFDSRYPEELRDTLVGTEIKTYSWLGESHDYVAGLEWLVDYAGPQLAMVGVYNRRVTPDFVSRTEELGVRFSIFGVSFEDKRLARGSTSPWLDALDSGAAAFLTERPEQLLELLGR